MQDIYLQSLPPQFHQFPHLYPPPLNINIYHDHSVDQIPKSKDIDSYSLFQEPAWRPSWVPGHPHSTRSDLDFSSPNLLVFSTIFLPTSQIRNYLLYSGWYTLHTLVLNKDTLNQTFLSPFPCNQPPASRGSFLRLSSFPTHQSTKQPNSNSPNLPLYSFLLGQNFLKA